MALLTNLLLLSASLICVVESAPTGTITATEPMGSSVADRDAIRHRANFCTSFLRRSNGSPMKEDMATYYAKKNCSMDNIFLTVLDTRRGHDMLVELIVQEEKNASICEGFIAVLSLIDAHNLTEDMCAKRVLVSESHSFCDNWQPTDSKAVVQMLTQSRYELVKAAADVLSKLDGKEGCLEVCGGAIDSAICSSFMDAAKFFSNRVLQDQPGTNGAREPGWITKTGGRGNESPAPDTDGTTMKVESNSGTDSTAMKVEPSSDNKSDPKLIQDTDNKGSTKEEGVDSAAPTGVGVNDEQSTVSTTSWLSKFVQKNNVSEEELQLVMKKWQEEKNQSRLSSQPTTQVPTDDDAVDQKKEISLPTDRPSSAALGELTLALPSATDKVAQETPVIGEDGTTGSNPLVNDVDTTPSKAVGNGDDRKEEDDQYRETPGRGDDDFFDRTVDDENDQKWGGLEPGLGENQHENTNSKPTADEHPPPVADKHPPPIKPSQINSNNESENEQKSYGAWHFFTIFLVIAGSAVVCYVCVHNRKKIREGVSSYTSDKKRRRRVRDYQPLSTTGKM